MRTLERMKKESRKRLLDRGRGNVLASLMGSRAPLKVQNIIISRTFREVVQLILSEPPTFIILIPNSPPSLPLCFGFQPVDESPIRHFPNTAYPVSPPPCGQICMDACLIMDGLALLELRDHLLLCYHTATSPLGTRSILY